jgi:hypothetical protein
VDDDLGHQRAQRLGPDGVDAGRDRPAGPPRQLAQPPGDLLLPAPNTISGTPVRSSRWWSIIVLPTAWATSAYGRSRSRSAASAGDSAPSRT